MLKLCDYVTFPCTTASVSRDGCLIQAWTINLCPEMFGFETGSQDNLFWRSRAGIRVVVRLNAPVSYKGPISSYLLLNILDVTSNCMVQSVGVAGNCVYSPVDHICRGGRSVSQRLRNLFYVKYISIIMIF